MRLPRIAAIAAILTLVLAAPVSAGAGIDLSVTKTDTPDPVVAGANITYTITVTNPGAGNAALVELSDTIPAGATFVSFTSPAGWSSTTPAVGGTGEITSTIASLPAGSAVFTLVVNVSPSAVAGTVISNTASVASDSADDNQANNSATSGTTVAGAAASVPDAAMAEPSPTNPALVLGFVALLLAALGATAVLSGRRVRS